MSCVSTIIPVWNRSGLLKEAVQSVLVQTYRPIEIIIVNDGSTDETPAVADQLAAQSDGLIRVLHVANGGVGLAREHGRRAATGEFIQYLDSDDVLWPRKFEIQVSALSAKPECGVAYGKTRLVRDDGVVLASPYKRSAENMDYLFPALLVDRWWNTLTPLYRKSVCDAVGPWSDMRMGEDWEYEARVGGLRTRLVYCDEFVADVREHSQGRLTGGGTATPVVLQNTARLIQSLFNNANRAGVELSSPEMRHFSRWSFSTARQLGAIGANEAAEKCFLVARAAAGDFADSREFRGFRVLTNLVGWRIAGSASEWLFNTLKRKPGIATQRQSWDHVQNPE